MFLIWLHLNGNFQRVVASNYIEFKRYHACSKVIKTFETPFDIIVSSTRT